ncbi:MAG: hypothetical protein AB1630_03960 [bacterium]
MIEFIRSISIFVSLFAIIAAVILIIRSMLQEKRFKFVRQEDAKKIETLSKEREELKKELIEKLDMLAKSSDLERNTLLEIIKRRDEKGEEEKEDLTNWLEYRMTRMQDEIENKIKDRLTRILLQIEDINARLLKLEKPSGG